MKILIINGPNLNLLGKREPEVYGIKTIDDLECEIRESFNDIELEFFQSNHEGKIIDKLHEVFDKIDGVVINPAAFTHYSYAIHDAIKAINIPVIEVHISNIHKREEFRQRSVIASACVGQISGMGFYGYKLGIDALINIIKYK